MLIGHKPDLDAHWPQTGGDLVDIHWRDLWFSGPGHHFPYIGQVLGEDYVFIMQNIILEIYFI